MTTNPKGYMSNYWKQLKKKLHSLYGNRCYFCSATTGLEFAHVLPTKLNGKGRGRSRRLIDVKHNTDKYLLTCKKHNNLAEIIKND